MIRVDHPRLYGMLAIGASCAVVSMAAAQASKDDNKPVVTRGQPVRSQAPARMSGLGGVRSQPGVRSAAPRPIPTSTFGRPLAPTTVSLPTRTERVLDSGGGPRGYYVVPTVRDGVSISGSYSDGPFKIAFSTGGLTRIVGPGRGYIVPVYTGCYGGVMPYAGVGSYYVNDAMISSNYAAPRTQTTIATRPADDAQHAQPSAPLTVDERAALRLKRGDAAGAVASYQAILKQRPGDGDVMRSLGVSLIDSGRLSDGVAVIAMAYKTDSTLPERPLNADVFQDGTERLRQHLNRVSALANKERSGTAWFVLATLMQAEGRHRQAAAMVDRARAAGVDAQVADELAGALSGSTP